MKCLNWNYQSILSNYLLNHCIIFHVSILEMLWVRKCRNLSMGWYFPVLVNISPVLKIWNYLFCDHLFKWHLWKYYQWSLWDEINFDLLQKKKKKKKKKKPTCTHTFYLFHAFNQDPVQFFSVIPCGVHPLHSKAFQYYVMHEKSKSNYVIFPSGCAARAF